MDENQNQNQNMVDNQEDAKSFAPGNVSELANPEKVEKVLRQLRRRSEEEEASRLAARLTMPYIDLNIFPADQESIFIISEEDSLKYGLIVIHKREKRLKIATVDPEEPAVKEIVNKLERVNGFQVELFVVSKTSLQRAQELYKKNKLIEVFD